MVKVLNILICQLVFGSIAASAEPIEKSNDAILAINKIEAAIKNLQSVPYLVAVSESNVKGEIVKTTLSIYRDQENGHVYGRKEKVGLKKGVATPRSTIFISRPEGYFYLRGTRVVKLGPGISLYPIIPADIRIRVKRMGYPPEYLIENGIEINGVRRTRITMTCRPLETTDATLTEEGSKSDIESKATPQEAWVHIYILDADLNVITGFQSFDKEGNELTDLSFKNIQFPSSLPLSTFEIPAGSVVETSTSSNNTSKK